MGRFFAGFLTASLLWGALGALYASGILKLASPAETTADEPGPDAGRAVDEEPRRRRRGARGSGRSRGARGRAAAPTGTATSGEDLGEDDPRNLDVAAAGGEEQLSSQQIEQAFDAAFGRIRRCLVLVPGDGPVSGKLVFGLRIEGSGTVSRVNLTGPAAATTGEAGACLRDAARAVRFASFDGPPMIVRYPITLE